MLRSQLTINYFANAKSINLISVLHQYEISRSDLNIQACSII